MRGLVVVVVAVGELSCKKEEERRAGEESGRRHSKQSRAELS